MKTKTLQNLVVAGIILSLSGPALAAQDAATTEALALYTGGKYSQALAKFEAISAKNPKDAITHYYMALCLHGLNQVARASSEYQLAINNTRSAKLKDMAQKGQESLNRYSNTRTKPASASTIATATPEKTSDSKTASGEKTDGKDAKDAKGKDAKADTKPAAGAGKVKKVIAFVSSWERMSLAFEPTLEGAKSKLSGKVEVVRIDENDPNAATLKEKYGVGSSLPMMVYLDDKGKVLASESGEDIEGQVDRLNGKKPSY
jgi:thioredoxin-like negative regulator of GroEL